jgi:hypothetical protein
MSCRDIKANKSHLDDGSPPSINLPENDSVSDV